MALDPRHLLPGRGGPRPPVRRALLHRGDQHRASTAGRSARPAPRPAGTCGSSRMRAAAETAGFRACRRCRPEASPGSPDWNTRADLAARAVRLITRIRRCAGISGLAPAARGHRAAPAPPAGGRAGCTGHLPWPGRCGCRPRGGCWPRPSMPITEIAFASGFSSVRQFNASFRSPHTPAAVRTAWRPRPRVRGQRHVPPGARSRAPAPQAPTPQAPTPQAPAPQARAPQAPTDLALAPAGLPRAVRSAGSLLGLPGRTGHSRCRAGGGGPVRADDTHLGWRRGHRCCTPAGPWPGARAAPGPARLGLGGVGQVVSRCRQLLDVDADPARDRFRAGRRSRSSPRWSDARPGLRMPGAYDGFELAVRAVSASRSRSRPGAPSRRAWPPAAAHRWPCRATVGPPCPPCYSPVRRRSRTLTCPGSDSPHPARPRCGRWPGRGHRTSRPRSGRRPGGGGGAAQLNCPASGHGPFRTS